jgi:DNA polymerase-3 subunit alpha
MFGVFKFVAEAGKHKNEDGTPKVKPIVGCEFYVVGPHKKQFTREDKDQRFHQLMLAKNATGYKNLSKLCSLGYIEGFYSKYPRIDKETDPAIPRGADRHHLLSGGERASHHPEKG